MKSSNANKNLFTTGFLLSKIGKSITDKFAERIASIGIRPRHCGLLATVKAYPPMSQQELGRALGLVPSAIVTMLDELKTLDAISRVEDPKDRRRYTIELTPKGETLLSKATEAAIAIDNECLAVLSKTERDVLAQSLRSVATKIGLVPRMP
jgi:DNA-binding MarR family transcriptional regulator